VCVFSVAAIADQCDYKAVLIKEKINVEEAKEEFIQEPEKEAHIIVSGILDNKVVFMLT